MSKKTALTIAALIALQAALYMTWRAVESSKPSPTALARTGAPAEVMDTRMESSLPELELRRADDTTSTLREALGSGSRPRLVHVWATWCPPCRDELPGLLAYGDSGEADVLAVSVDSGWEEVRALLGPTPREQVALARGQDVRDALDVRALPVTFVVDASGTLRLRLDGARDWADPELRARVAAASATPPATPHTP